jgi:uncharacterized protein with PIN domain
MSTQVNFSDFQFMTGCSFCKGEINRKKDGYIIIYKHKGFFAEQFKLCDKCTEKFMKNSHNKKWINEE